MNGAVPGQVVRIITSSVSLVSGRPKKLEAGTLGRVCKVTPFGFC